MKSIFVLFVGFVISMTANAEKSTFGDTITLKETQSLDVVLNSFKKYEDKEILVQGEVQKVCKKKGCWMTLNTAKGEVRVVFKDYGFMVPKEIKGKQVQLQGKVIQKMVSVREQKHMLEDEKASKEKIAAVKEPRPTYRFVASGVKIVK